MLDSTGTIDSSVFLAEGSVVIGDVSLGPDSSVWFNAVLRGDDEPIIVGARSNIQDNVVVHVNRGFPVRIGADVTIGHGAIVHGCTVGDNTVVGMGAILLDGAQVGEDCVIGAGALVTQGAVIPAGHLAFGSPAKVIRPLTPEEIEYNRGSAAFYVEHARIEVARAERLGR